jgi:ZIP family zinc transporter
VDLSVLLALVLPGLATTLGGFSLLWFPSPSGRVLDGLLGFTAGIMLAATVFGLLVPALDEGSLATVVLGLVAGTALVLVLDRVLPHAHARFAEPGRPLLQGTNSRLHPELLLTAMTIHNLPEGLAVGAAFAAGGWSLGLPIAVAIAVQNVPEGFAAAAPFAGPGTRPIKLVGIAAATGAVEPPAALLAYTALQVSGSGLALGLGLAAGAMLYVIVDELIPESQAHGNERLAAVALLGGFVVMLVLDQALS